MADVEVLIKVDKKDYERIRVWYMIGGDKSLGNYEKLIAHGVSLPEEHGRLADVDAVIKALKNIERLYTDDELWGYISNALYGSTLNTEPEIDEEMEIEF